MQITSMFSIPACVAGGISARASGAALSELGLEQCPRCVAALSLARSKKKTASFTGFYNSFSPFQLPYLMTLYIVGLSLCRV